MRCRIPETNSAQMRLNLTGMDKGITEDRLKIQPPRLLLKIQPHQRPKNPGFAIPNNLAYSRLESALDRITLPISKQVLVEVTT